MMEGFNPLDLLASAAELQQKHDDGPERIIISRQKRYNPTKIYVNTNEQKENREQSTASNNTKTKPSVVIVKKIRKSEVNSELEKMLDEHNYGNAKRNYCKMEKSLDSATQNSEEKRPAVDKVLDNGKVSEQTLSDGQIVGNVKLVTNSSSEMYDSENVVNSSNGSSNESSNCTCANYQGLLDQKCSVCDSQENKEITVEESQQNSDPVGPINGSVSTSDKLIVKCDEKDQNNCNTIITESDMFTLIERGVELNEHTGELIYKNVADGTIKQSSVKDSEPVESSTDGVESPSKPDLDDQSQTLKLCSSGKTISENKLESQTISIMPKSLAVTTDMKIDVGHVKTYSVQKKIGLRSNNNSEIKKPAGLNITQTCLESQNYDDLTLNKKSVTYDSLNYLEIGNTMCAENASSSVHLLSPDRRNPDSVGIVSPKTHHENEFCLENQYLNSNVNQDVLRKLDKEKALTESIIIEIGNPSMISLQSNENKSNNAVSSSHLTSSPINTDVPSVETATDCRALNVDSGLLFTEKLVNCEKSANKTLSLSASENDVFHLDSDHCYAGVQRKVNTRIDCGDIQNESEEVKTPQGSLSEWSQDSGYEDITQSPEIEQQQTMSALVENNEKPPAVKSLVPVLVSLNKNGSLTVHDNSLTRTLGGSIFFNENMKLITGTNLNSMSKVPLSSSDGKVASPLTEALKSVKSKPEGVTGMLTPKKQDLPETIPQEMSPPKYGKFRIGTFASFSNTGPCLEAPPNVKSFALKDEDKLDSNSRITGRSNSGKCSPIVDTLGSLVQKVKSSLSPASHLEQNVVDHIQHDHDYCTKNLMPSVVNSFLEARLLSKDNVKGKVSHAKGKKSDSEYKTDSKSYKRKRSSSTVTKEETIEDFDVDSESDTHGVHPSYRQKYRAEKYVETKRTDPKVKITGSSNFQDQFVYFMNTKKRSRRRESKDIPTSLPNGTERVFIPPKPGDIVVPHLTDQDIENLKLRSKQGKNSSGTPCSNNLRNEFMAAKLSNGVFPSTQPPETVDDEKTIINTILSLENEDLVSPNQSESVAFNESMEMYGQGLNADIMNLLPEQMNLTPEQIDMLYSAVDEVQNSVPDIVEADKLVSRGSSEADVPFQSDTYNGSVVACSTTTSDCEGKAAGVQLPIDISKDNFKVICTESEKAEVDTNICATANQSKFETSGDMNDIEQVTQKYENAGKNADETGICEATNTSTVSDDHGPSSKIDFSVLPLSSDADSTLKHLDQPYGKDNGVCSMVETTIVSSEKTLLSTATLDSSRGSTFETDINSVTTGSLTTEMSIPHIDKSLFLGNDFDKGDLFPEGSVAPPAQVDYNAPWIVTVSMYWNDLPAIMINNQPFVRLVDIHKQILPAKDTGILKKRCQLMNIEVDNCSEMQRYFLVQYGKAFNSKSTLIISKDDAKVLIGYYVDPQPKTLRPEDHKSIVDHRREQLRRIALARRSAIRAQKLVEKKGDSDPRDIRQSKDETDFSQPIHCSLQEQKKNVAKLPSSLLCNQVTVDDGYCRQRATRHKKINFLEMLRGDSGSLGHGEESVNENVKHKVKHSEALKKKMAKEKKVKVAKYTIETDSSEETDSVVSDYNSGSSDTKSTSDLDVKVVKRPVEPKFSPIFLAKVKQRAKGISKPFRKKNLKRGLKQPKPSLTSTPMAIQVVNKSLAVSKVIKSVYKPTLKSRKELPKKKGILGKNSAMSEKGDIDNSIDIDQKSHHDYVTKDSNPADSASKSMEETTKKSDNVVSTNIEPPSNAVDDTDKNLNTDDMQGQNTHKSLQSFESVTVQTDSAGIETDTGFIHTDKTDNVNLESMKNDNSTARENNSEMNFKTVDIEDKSPSGSSENSSTSTMKRKSNVQIRSDETPVRIIHREVSPEEDQKKTRSQLGELFVDHYHNKRSACVRCYTCRKLMSVDNFLHHLHDVSGGLLSVTSPQIIDLSDESIDDNESKLWETFLRKKELFDNNQLPTDSRGISEGNLVYDIEDNSYSKHSIDEKPCQSGPRIITTPVSPMKSEKILHKQKSEGKKKSQLISNQWANNVPGFQKQKMISDDTTVRTSSRKRKMKNLYGFENYSFTKFPRLMKNAVVEDEEN